MAEHRTPLSARMGRKAVRPRVQEGFPLPPAMHIGSGLVQEFVAHYGVYAYMDSVCRMRKPTYKRGDR